MSTESPPGYVPTNEEGGTDMETAWLLIIAAVAAMGSASWLICKTQAAQRISERIGFGDDPAWKK